jgi:hypothetical protein
LQHLPDEYSRIFLEELPMKLLTSLTAWKQWIRSEEGRFAYMELKNWGQALLGRRISEQTINRQGGNT